MMIVLGHFLIAAAAAITASAIIGFFLTTLLIRLLQKVDRSSKFCRGKVPAFCAPVAITIHSVLSANHISRDQRDFSGRLTHCRVRMIRAPCGLAIIAGVLSRPRLCQQRREWEIALGERLANQI